jgi:hypothetical protein
MFFERTVDKDCENKPLDFLYFIELDWIRITTKLSFSSPLTMKSMIENISKVIKFFENHKY